MLSPKTGSLRDWTLDKLSHRFSRKSDLLILLEEWACQNAHSCLLHREPVVHHWTSGLLHLLRCYKEIHTANCEPKIEQRYLAALEATSLLLSGSWETLDMPRKTFNTYPPFQNMISQIRVNTGRVSWFRVRFGLGPVGGYVEFPERCLTILLALDPDHESGLETGDFFLSQLFRR